MTRSNKNRLLEAMTDPITKFYSHLFQMSSKSVFNTKHDCLEICSFSEERKFKTIIWLVVAYWRFLVYQWLLQHPLYFPLFTIGSLSPFISICLCISSFHFWIYEISPQTNYIHCTCPPSLLLLFIEKSLYKFVNFLAFLLQNYCKCTHSIYLL